MMSFFLFSALLLYSVSTESFVIPVTENADFLVVEIEKNDSFFLECDPKNATSVKKWRERLGAKWTANASFFDDDFKPVGFAQTTKNTWGNADDHSAVFFEKNGERKIVLSEHFVEKETTWGTSGFPVLVWNGKVTFTKETKKYARRTGIFEKNERLFLYISVRGTPSLYETAIVLEKFGVDKALNVDGGTSTGFSSEFTEIASLPVPCVFVMEK